MSHKIISLTQHKRKTILYTVSFMLLIDSIAYGVIFPLMPELFLDPTLGFGVSNTYLIPFLYSATLTSYPLAQFFGMGFFGSLSDKYGRKPMLLIGVGIIVIAYFLSMIAVLKHNLSMFIISRLLSGFSAGIYGVSNALVGDISGEDDKKRLTNFRFPILAVKLGTTIGPGLSIFAVSNTYIHNTLVIPFLITFILALINFFVFFYHFRKLDLQDISQKLSPSSSFTVSNLLGAAYSMFRNKANRLLALGLLAYQIGSSLFTQGLPLYLALHLHYCAKQIAFVTLVMGVIVIISSYLSKHLKNVTDYNILLRKTVLILVLLFSFFLIVNLSHDYLFSLITRIWITSSLFYISLPLTQLLFTTSFLNSVPKTSKGSAMGAMGQISALSKIISASIVGHVVLYSLIIPISGTLFLTTLISLIKSTKNSSHSVLK